MKLTNNIRRLVVKMAHVRMQVGRQLFGEVMDDFAYSLRGSCVSVKEELRRPQRRLDSRGSPHGRTPHERGDAPLV